MSALVLLLWSCLCTLPPTTGGLLLVFPSSRSRSRTGTRILTKGPAVVVTGGGVCSCYSFVPPQSRTTSMHGHVRNIGYATTTTRATTICRAKQGDEADNDHVSATTSDDEDGLVPSSAISPPLAADTSGTDNNDTATVLLATVAFVSFWPLLALLRAAATTSPSDLIDGFDVDMFMALKGILDDSNSNMNMNMNNIDAATTIMELPPLSPAEQLVGAIFGPPPATTITPPRY